MGIAVAEGAVESIEDPIGMYVPEFAGTDLESIPIRACLQMASGIDFNEDTDCLLYTSMSQDYELKHVEFLRAIAGGLL